MQGKANLCHFYHAAKDIWLLVHGDDFVSCADEGAQAWLKKVLSDEYEIKHQIAGEAKHLAKELKVLGRVITYQDGGLSCEADPQHLDICVQELGLSQGKGVASPGARDVSLRSAE